MKRALFVTVAGHELYAPVNAWRSTMGPCGHITFNAAGPQNDEAILACAKGYEPDVIIYIGANGGAGLPSVETFQALRQRAPCVHYQSDVEDETWHELLELYRENNCFDLIASQTGVDIPQVDYTTLIAVDTDAFLKHLPDRHIRCGFSGSYQSLRSYEELKGKSAPDDPRGSVLHGLGKLVWLRKREPVGDYRSYIDFMRQCQLMLNVSFTGMWTHHHVKWRVLEAAFAGCALLEMKDSPTKNWFPAETYLTYDSVEEAEHIIKTITRDEIAALAEAFGAYAREHYSPQKIYGGILKELGIKL